MGIADRITKDRRSKQEKFEQMMASPPGNWWKQFLCSLNGGHHYSSARFEGQRPIYLPGVGYRVWYYGKCPRCFWHVYYDGELDRWYDDVTGPPADVVQEKRSGPPPPPIPIPPSWI